ncbi:MAG: DUF4097 family beta strand repeat-containing protein [Candidatus Saccharibacteria bacterium]
MRKAGTITTAAALVILGGLLLINQLAPDLAWAQDPVKWWPLLLVGLGVEIIIMRIINKEEPIKADPLIFVFLIIVLIAGIYGQIRGPIWGQLSDSGVFGWKYTDTKHYPVNAATIGIDTLTIDMPTQDIKLVSGPEGNVKAIAKVTIHTNKKSSLPESLIQIQKQGSELKLNEIDRAWRSGFRSRELSSVVYVPKGIKVKVISESGNVQAENLSNPLNVEAESGNVELSNITGDLDLRLESGNISLRQHRGNARITDENGEITVADSKGEIEIIGQNGNVALNESYGRIKASAESGNVAINNSKGLTGDCRLSTQNGNIELRAGTLSDCKVTVEGMDMNLPAYLTDKLKPPAIPVPPSNVKDNPVQPVEPIEPGREVNITLGNANKNIELRTENGTIIVR